MLSLSLRFVRLLLVALALLSAVPPLVYHDLVAPRVATVPKPWLDFSTAVGITEALHLSAVVFSVVFVLLLGWSFVRPASLPQPLAGCAVAFLFLLVGCGGSALYLAAILLTGPPGPAPYVPLPCLFCTERKPPGD